MSSFYLDILKERLYTDHKRSLSGRSCRTVLVEILTVLVKMLSPVLSFTCEEVWGHLGRRESIHLENWPKGVPKHRDLALEEKWERFLAIRERVLKALEEKREKKEIGNSLEADVELTASKEEEAFLKSFEADLPGLLLVSRVRVRSKGAPDTDGMDVVVARAQGGKCERCWNYRESVGQQKEHPTLCSRCVRVVRGEYS